MGNTSDTRALDALEQLALKLWPLSAYMPAWERRQRAEGLLAELRGIGWELVACTELEYLRDRSDRLRVKLDTEQREAELR